MSVWVLHACLVLTEVRKEHCIPGTIMTGYCNPPCEWVGIKPISSEIEVK